ncbi:MAG: putative ABC transporter permease [Candidatus Heteroscillospira sp.]|jgi:uncharacterized membrane protein
MTAVFHRSRFDRMFLCFLMYSILGWCYEVFLEVIVYRWGYSDRGVLFGPWCPVYGVGAMLLLLCFSRTLRAKLPFPKNALRVLGLFLGCMAVATALELAASYMLEAATGAWPWQTYRDYRWNFQGRIALSPSLRFGLGGLLFLYALQPLFERILNAIGEGRVRKYARVMLGIFSLDCLAFALKLII